MKKQLLKRYENNPILKANEKNDWESLCVLNPAVIFDDKREKFVMLYRAAGHDAEHIIQLGHAESDDGINFTRMSDKPCFAVDALDADAGCIEDPRFTKIDDIYYVVYAGKAFSPGQYWLKPEEFKKKGYDVYPKAEKTPAFYRDNITVSYLAMTEDFKNYRRLGRITDSRFDDRDVYLFPEKVGGKYVKISRPQMPFNDTLKMHSVWISYSDDLVEWHAPELLFSGAEEWESLKIGGGSPPIKTDKGWFMLYHGVDNEGVYRVGAVILDLLNPSKLIARTKNFILEPTEEYEVEGFYNKCVFPTANVVKDGKIYIYYGCADKYISLVTADFNELIENTLNENNSLK